MIGKIWRSPLFLLFAARFLATCVKNCSTVPKLKMILQLHCGHTVANSLCFKSLALCTDPPLLSTNRFLLRGGGVCKQALNRWSTKNWNSRACGKGGGGGGNPPFVISLPYGPETQRRRLFFKTSFPGSARTWGRGCKTIFPLFARLNPRTFLVVLIKLPHTVHTDC